MQTKLANLFSVKDDNVWVIEDDFFAFREKERFGIFMTSRQPGNERWHDSLNNLALDINKSFFSPQGEQKGVFFSCADENLRAVFAVECCNLYVNKEEFLADPKSWWENFKALTGDSIGKITTKAFFAEFATWLYLKKNYPCDVLWGSLKNSHDIQSVDGGQHEVKSSESRHSATITISSSMQNSSGNGAFYYYFNRIESDREDGLSINDLLQFARSMNCDMNSIERILEKQKIFPYSDERNKKFFIEDFWRYDAKDPRFPRITLDSFKDEVNVAAIAEISSYSINLDALTDLRVDLTREFQNTFVQLSAEASN